MIESMEVNQANMLSAARAGYINATDLADYMVGKGVAFRDAHGIVGAIVKHCQGKGQTLEEVTLAEYENFCPQIEEDVYAAIAMKACAEARGSYGGGSSKSVKQQLKNLKKIISKW
jgi:argininosuccinate lyase